MLSPAKFRYNYINPFFFYTINNFPIQPHSRGNHPVPFFNFTKNNINNTTYKSDYDMLSTKSDNDVSMNQKTVHQSNTIMSPIKKIDNGSGN